MSIHASIQVPVRWMPRWLTCKRFMKMPVEDRREGVPQGGRTLKLQENSELDRKERERRKNMEGEYYSTGKPRGKPEPKMPMEVLQLSGVGLDWHCSHAQSVAKSSL